MRQIPESALPGTRVDRWQQIWSHREQLLRVARRRSTSPQDAEDAVHEAMARAAERPHLDGDRLGAWLTAVTVRLCVDQHRQLSRDTGIRRRAGSMLTAPSAVPHEEVVCDHAEALWLARQGTELPENQRVALRLKAQDLDVAQVAQRMGLTYKAAESLLGRARRTLRAALAATLAAVAVGLWRGRPGVNGGTPAAVSPAVLASAGTLMLAGLVLMWSPGADGGPASRPVRDGRSDVVFVSSREEPGVRPSVTSAAVTDPERPGVRAVPGPASRPADTSDGADGLVEGGGGPAPVQGPLPGVPAAELPAVPAVPTLPAVPPVPSLPSVPPLPVPALEPGDVVRPSSGVPVLPDPLPSVNPPV
jgi:RNA polymerase sigma factor (sigma-70 family)